jgi:dihydrofolate synthase / folylpolyglutamate synthase
MTLAEAERYLLGLELFGMRFGLDRMRRLMTVLGSPQERYGTIHVVGTNGKSSTVRMIAAILRRHGLRTGAYLSPHLVSFTERVRIDDEDSSPERFAAAGVEVAVIEAGLGGRYDATNVIPSRVQVLTNVGLEHTRWLGPTVADIAAEKLDVVRPGGTLVVGPDLHPDALALARETAADRGARLVLAGTDPGVEVLARGAYQRRNFAVARAAAEAYLGELDEEAVRAAAASTLVPGRFEVVGREPDTVLDSAHNPDGMTALVEALRGFLDGRPLVACISILDDKDAAGMLRELLPLCTEVVCTSNANPRALSPATLESLCRQLGGPPTSTVRDPRRALAAAREAAGPGGVALATGSIYLIADLLRPADATRRSTM